jgi:hypothetical protein
MPSHIKQSISWCLSTSLACKGVRCGGEGMAVKDREGAIRKCATWEVQDRQAQAGRVGWIREAVNRSLSIKNHR